MQQYAGDVLHFVGGVGLFFSFTEVSKMSQNNQCKDALQMSNLYKHIFPSFRSLEFGSPTDTGTLKILDQILEPFYNHQTFKKQC